MPSSGSITQRRPLAAVALGSLLGDHAVVGPLGAEERGDHLLGVAVGVGDQVGARGLALHPAGRRAEALAQQLPRGTGGTLGQIQVFGEARQSARATSTTATITATTTTT